MRCQQCEVDVSLDFTYAIEANLCPKCGNDIMSSERHDQYLFLIQDLKRVLQVTSNPNINQKIVNQVSSVLMDSYKFRKIGGASKARRKTPKAPTQQSAQRPSPQPAMITLTDDLDDIDDDIEGEVTFRQPMPRVGGPRGGGASSGPRVARVEGTDRVPVGSEEF